MGKNTDFNRAAGSIYWTAMHAAQALAVTLPDAPPIPALPTWPLSLRALTWCKGVLASAEAASPDLAEPGRITDVLDSVQERLAEDRLPVVN